MVKTMTDQQRMLTLSLPEAAWDLLNETLVLDAESSSFDPQLSADILEALRQVVQDGCVVSRISRSDLERAGCDASAVDDAQLEQIAHDLDAALRYEVFWECLEGVLEKHGVPQLLQPEAKEN